MRTNAASRQSMVRANCLGTSMPRRAYADELSVSDRCGWRPVDAKSERGRQAEPHIFSFRPRAGPAATLGPSHVRLYAVDTRSIFVPKRTTSTTDEENGRPETHFGAARRYGRNKRSKLKQSFEVGLGPKLSGALFSEDGDEFASRVDGAPFGIFRHVWAWIERDWAAVADFDELQIGQCDGRQL